MVAQIFGMLKNSMLVYNMKKQGLLLHGGMFVNTTW